MNLHLGILQIIAFSLLKLTYKIQYVLSYMFWHIIGQPIVFTFWLYSGKKRRGETRIIRFREENKKEYMYGILLKHTIKINGLLNGIKNNFSLYDFLLSWNPAIPLIAIDLEKVNYRSLWLGKGDDSEGHPLESDAFIGTSQLQGHLRITEKRYNERDRIEIECVWLSGENKGEKFIVGYYNNPKGTPPRSIYFPPRLFIIGLESIISLSVATAAVSLIYYGINYIVKYLA